MPHMYFSNTRGGMKGDEVFISILKEKVMKKSKQLLIGIQFSLIKKLKPM